jgi:ABC-type transport system involved in multi-copper enzyme maturation permease subunit
MATITATVAAARPVAGLKRPSFWGLMRGEWLKISRQWTFWIMVGLMFGGYALYALLDSKGRDLAQRIEARPLDALASVSQAEFFLLRVFWGMMLIILTARLIGMEYSSGTVRVILARGVGRAQLLLAQLSVMALIALAGAAVFLAWASLLNLIVLQAVLGNLSVFNAVTGQFWRDIGAYALASLLSLGVSILLAAAVTAMTRSLATGLTVSVIWFPIDNFSIILLLLAIRLTKWDFWSLLSGDFLGLNLNAMPGLVMSPSTPNNVGTFFQPLTPVTGAHTLLIAAMYAVVFMVTAFALTLRRDVLE